MSTHHQKPYTFAKCEGCGKGITENNPCTHTEDDYYLCKDCAPALAGQPEAETPLPCPFCGSTPIARPRDPEKDWWAEIRCTNSLCPARPRVGDGLQYKPECAGSFQKAAIKRWNTREAIDFDKIAVRRVLAKCRRLLIAAGYGSATPTIQEIDQSLQETTDTTTP